MSSRLFIVPHFSLGSLLFVLVRG